MSSVRVCGGVEVGEMEVDSSYHVGVADARGAFLFGRR